MKQLSYATFGKPCDVVHLVEAPTPLPGPGEVLIALEAAPIHIADLKAIAGELPFVPAGPGIPGFEGVGRVAALGEAVTGWSPGDRAILPLGYGTWRDFVPAPANALWRAPDHAAAAQLALVRINLVTAYLLLHAYRVLRAGDWIIQNAANSNVGGYIARLAALSGINVIDIVRRDSLPPMLHAAGRRHVLLDSETLAGEVRAIAGTAPVLALDAIGGPATARLGQAVGDGGLVLCYGFLAEKAYRIAYQDAIYRGVSLRGMSIDRAMARLTPPALAEMRANLEAFVAAEALDARIAGIYPFAEAAQALRHAGQTGEGRSGKVILVPF